MTPEEYSTLTGIPVTSSNLAMITAQIAQSKAILEALLGYSLDDPDANQYVEQGKTQSDCPCPDDVDLDDLLPPDDPLFTYAYRLFPYNKDDRYLYIDPATAVHKVKLVRNGVTYRTLDASDYGLVWKNGIVKFLDQTQCWCLCTDCDCNNVQLAVDADWLGKDDYPTDLLMLWANMTTWYADPKNGIKSETLGPHSYTKFDNKGPEQVTAGIVILKKYAGPNGTVSQIPTV